MNNVRVEFPYQSHFVNVHGAKMHYVEQGNGDSILFLHGMPASCYVWRNVIPYLSTLGCCIAPDLIGMGKSDKPDIEYSIADHINYVEAFINTLDLKNITLVMHGWGSIIGLDYAMRNENKCKALVFYEGYVKPIQKDEISLPMYEQMQLFEQEKIFDSIMNSSFYIDKILPQEMLHSLTQEELSHYRAPFTKQGDGKALCQYIKELLITGKDDKLNQRIENYSNKLKQSKLPKLMLYSIPGFLTTVTTVMWAKENLPNLEVIDVGEELHYAQENNPALMGEAISVWLQGIEQQHA